MKARSNKKSHNITVGSDFHRQCHLAYMPRLVKQPRPTKPDQTRQRIRPEHYIVISEHSEQEDTHPVKTKCNNDDIKQRKYVNEPQEEDPEQLIESYIGSSYYNDPVIVGCDSMKSSAPIKKISFNIPEEDKKCHSDNEQMDWNDYHTLGVIHKFMDDLESDFPALCTTTIIGTSVEGRNLKTLKISNSDASNAAVWVDAGIHAREWIAPAVNTYIANQITRNFESLPESIRNKDWYFLPVVNPDGYEYTHTRDRMWRKNRAWHCGQCVGVDLNRNFSFGWGGKGSSDTPTNAFYKGPRPFSEPESSAIRDVFLKSGINFKVYITLHSYGQIIIFPYACSSNLAPDYVRLLEGATAMSKAIYNTNGNTYKVGISRDVMYGAAGTSNDFAHGAAGIPYCYLIELRSKKHKFRLPKEEIEETGNEILNCVKALMEFVDTYKYTKKPDDSQQCDYEIEKPNSFVTNHAVIYKGDSCIRKRSSYDKKSYPYAKNSDSSIKNCDSYVRWSHLPQKKVDFTEKTCDTRTKSLRRKVYEVNNFSSNSSKTINTNRYEEDVYSIDYLKHKRLNDGSDSFLDKNDSFMKRTECFKDSSDSFFKQNQC